MEENEKREFENMVSGEFKDFINGYREVVTQINGIDVEDKTSQIVELEEDIRQNETKIQKGNVYRQVNVKTFEEYAQEFMENIKNDQEKIEELRRFNQEVLPENIRRKEELENKYRANVRENAKEKRDALLSELKGQKIEFKESEELTNLNKEIADVQSQIDARMEEYNAILKSEEENPRAVRDEKYKQFLLDEVNRMKKSIEPKLLQKEKLSKDIMDNVEEVNGKIDEKIKIVNEQYRECLKDFTRIDNGEKDSVLLEAESVQNMNNKKAEKSATKKVDTQNRKVENTGKSEVQNSKKVEKSAEAKIEETDGNVDGKKQEKKVEPKPVETLFSETNDNHGFEIEPPKTKFEDHDFQIEEEEPEERIFDFDDDEQEQNDQYDFEQENQQSKVEEDVKIKKGIYDFIILNSVYDGDKIILRGANGEERELSDVEQEELYKMAFKFDLLGYAYRIDLIDIKAALNPSEEEKEKLKKQIYSYNEIFEKLFEACSELDVSKMLKIFDEYEHSDDVKDLFKDFSPSVKNRDGVEYNFSKAEESKYYRTAFKVALMRAEYRNKKEELQNGDLPREERIRLEKMAKVSDEIISAQHEGNVPEMFRILDEYEQSLKKEKTQDLNKIVYASQVKREEDLAAPENSTETKEKAESGKPENSENPNMASSDISQAEADLKKAINTARMNAENLNNISPKTNFAVSSEHVDPSVKSDNPIDKKEEGKAEQFTTDTSNLDDKFALTNDDNLKINFSVSKNGEPIIECDWGKSVRTFTLDDLDFSDTETLMNTHDVIMATIKELDDIYGTNKAEMFIDARAQSDILSKVKAVKDVAKIDIGMDLRRLYKFKPSRLLKTYRNDILEWAKKYSKEDIADVKMGLGTKAVDVLKTIGGVTTGIFKRGPKKFGKTSKLNALSAGDNNQKYETPEIHTLRTRHDIVVENKDNRIEKSAQQRMDEKKEEGVQQILNESQQTLASEVQDMMKNNNSEVR